MQAKINSAKIFQLLFADTGQHILTNTKVHKIKESYASSIFLTNLNILEHAGFFPLINKC